MSVFRRLSDGLPGRSAANEAGVPTDARTAREWVAALPMANRAEASARLLAALQNLSELRLEPAPRLAVLEALRAPVADLMSFLEQQILGSSFPLPSSRTELGRRARAFHAALALGYRCVVVDLCGPSGRVPFLRGKTATLALQRALFHQAAALTAHYMLYLKPAPGLWGPLHDLARFAESVGLADKTVEDTLAGSASSPSLLYRQAILVAVCNPYRFSQREQLDLHRAAPWMAAECEITRQAGAGAFLLPEGEDRGPGYLPSERSAAGDSELCLELGRLRAHLEERLKQGDAQIASPALRRRVQPLSADLARRCLASWGSAAERHHQRLPAGHQLDSIIGLSAMHYFLAGERDFESFMRQAHGVGATLAAGDAATWAGASTDASRPGIFSAQVVDQSLGGYQLTWDKSHAVRARVGELVGLSVPADGAEERDWMLGIIRWLRYDPEGGLEAGVELLARRARPVGLRPPAEKRGVRAAMRGIEFHPARGDGAEVLHVLAPAILDRHGAEIEVTRLLDGVDAEERFGVAWMRKVRRIEHTGDYLLLAGSLGDNDGSVSESVATP